MTYGETLDYLYNAAPAFEKVGASAYKEGLSNTLALDAHFGHPHTHYPTIHVAGTNGKGSTSHTIAAVLQEAGYKVGLYTSPHLVDFNERIKVNGNPIPHKYVVEFVENERNFFEPLHPSFFELTTALAFKYFAEQNVDIAVIEVGLGGRLDCTNIILPILSIITNISYDHTAFLGNTLQDIAHEKAGIIKPNIPVIIGEHNADTRLVFEQKAKEMHAPIYFAQDKNIIKSYTTTPEGIEYTTIHDNHLIGQLRGLYQINNTNTVLKALEILQGILQDNQVSCHRKTSDIPVKDTDLWQRATYNGFKNVCGITKLSGRWQTISHSPLTICDTGHNLAGWEYLSRQITKTWEQVKEKNQNSTLRIIFGMVDDKDVNSIMRILPKDAVYYFCQANTHRAIPAERLHQYAAQYGLSGTVSDTVKHAYQAALKESKTTDFIFIGGSSYVVADFLS